MSINTLSYKKPSKRLDDDDCMDESSEDTYQLHVYDNKIVFHGSVTEKSCFELIKAINNVSYTLTRYSNFAEIPLELHINSGGGDLFAALSVIETINRCKHDVITVCEGQACSAAALIFLAGSVRRMGKNSYIMIHEIRSVAWGKFSELQDDMKNNKKLMKDLKNYLSERTNEKMRTDKLSKFLKHDILWGYKKCLKYGIATQIW